MSLREFPGRAKFSVAVPAVFLVGITSAKDVAAVRLYTRRTANCHLGLVQPNHVRFFAILTSLS